MGQAPPNDGGGGGGGAKHVDVVPPPDPVQLQFHGPVPVTAVAVPVAHKPVAGAVADGVLFAGPHDP